jgi:ADP-ribose pyrophosphatase YjhB (NUDIX family)
MGEITNNTKWVQWARELQAISQNGLEYTKDPFDRGRFELVSKIAKEITVVECKVAQHEVEKVFIKELSYSTPKVAVRGAIFKENEILLVQEKMDGLWSLPGGWVDIGISPSLAIEKEILEETGLRAEPVKLIAVFDNLKHKHPVHLTHTYTAYFLCEIIEGCICTLSPEEILDVKFFPYSNLPKLSVVRVTPAQIKLCVEHHKNLSLPTYFD